MGKGEIGMKKMETNKILKYYCLRQRQKRERKRKKNSGYGEGGLRVVHVLFIMIYYMYHLYPCLRRKSFS